MSVASKAAAASSAGLILAASLLPLAILTLADVRPVHAAEPAAFTIPAEDGYGIADCFTAGNACGAAMASSWCEGHGHAKALAFGAADIVGTIPGAAEVASEPGAVMIRCGD